MDTLKKQALKPSPEQTIYANLLLVGVWSALAIMAITYFLYLSGILAPHVDTTLIPKVWGKGVGEYIEITHSPHGWGWLYLLGKGDFLNFIGFTLLGIMTIICFLVLVKGYIRRKDWIFAGIAILEILVLSLAASGLLGTGGH